MTFVDTDGNWAAQQAANGAALYYSLTFTDHFGGTYTTKPIVLSDNAVENARDAQLALETLPNAALPTVQVRGVVCHWRDAAAAASAVFYRRIADTHTQRTRCE